MSVEDCTNRVCVVGAGCSGLAAAKNLLQHGFEVDVLERGSDLGGLWNFHSPFGRVTTSTHMISSKRFTQFPDYPMPRSFPDYPHHSQVFAYLRDYARHFRVDERIEYGAAVQRIEPFEEGRWWDVRLESGAPRRYGAVVIANGHNWSPRWPQFEGRFEGEILHSADYKRPEVVAGKRVLVVGGGNSGCDVAVEAVHFAKRTILSLRRGYYFIPKYIFGHPSDRFADWFAATGLPLKLRRPLFAGTLRLVVGSPRRFGLPTPDHRLFETHPVVNSLLPYYVRHGTVQVRPDIRSFEGRTAVFVDGSREEVDIAIFATGYELAFPFIDPAHLNWRDGRPRLYKNVFHPEYDNLFLAGMIQPDSGVFGLVHWQTLAVARFLGLRRSRSPVADRFRRMKREVDEDLGHGIRYQPSSRHLLEVEHWSYLKGIKKIVRKLPSIQA